MKEIMASEIIDELGGTNEVARICEIEPPSVSEWRKNGIPKARLMYLKLLKPDVFERLEKEAASGNTAAYSGPERRVGAEPGCVIADHRKKAA